jgi:hypothetical protein
MQAGTTNNWWRPCYLVSLVMLVLMLLFFFSDGFRKSTDKDIPEFHVINNTSLSFLLRGYTDTAILMPAGSRVSFYDSPWLQKEPTLEEFVKKNMVKPAKASLMGCSPTLRHTFDWGTFTMPGESGWRKIYFARTDTDYNDRDRNNMNFLIHLLWILKLFTFIVLIESVLGLFHTGLPYKPAFVILAITFNFPVIYISSDFGYWVNYFPDIFFTLPLWALQPNSYFVSFSIPVGTILLFSALMIRKITVSVNHSAHYA